MHSQRVYKHRHHSLILFIDLLYIAMKILLNGLESMEFFSWWTMFTDVFPQIMVFNGEL